MIDMMAGTRMIVDMTFKDMFTRKMFSSWEEYWVYVITPVFFGYHCATKPPR